MSITVMIYQPASNSSKLRIHNEDGLWKAQCMATLKVVKTWDKLPDVIEERVALLRMMDVSELVAGLGFRYNEKTFYLDTNGEIDAAIKC